MSGAPPRTHALGMADDLGSNIVAAVRAAIGPADAMIPLHEPEFRGRERDYVTQCIDTGWVSSVGAFVDRIEHNLAEFTGVERAVAVVNGTAALHMCLRLVGVGVGDEVLIPALTFIATANAIRYAGASPRFVDSETETLAVDATKLDAHLREIATIRNGVCVNRRSGAPIRALIVVHVFGHPADLDALSEVADRWKLALIEDAAESLGSYYKGVHTGNRGVVSALSFNGNKVVTTGGGGAILTNDPDLGRRAKHLSTTARVPHRWNFTHDDIGYNYRMPNLNAAVGCAQIERLPDMITRKRVLAERYERAFEGLPGVRFLREPGGSRSNYWLNTIILEDAASDMQEAVLGALNDANYMSRPVWTLMHQLPMYARCPRASLDIVEQLARSIINLPSSPKLVD